MTVHIPEDTGAADDTRSRIIRAAAEVFAREGYAGATTRKLAAAAGVNEVTLFRHFGSKKNLFTSIIDEHSALPALDRIVAQQLTGDYRQDLIRVGSATLRAMLERRTAMRLMLCEAQRVPLVREIMASIPLRLRRMLAGYLRQQMEDGRVRPADPEVLAQAFLGMLFAHAVSPAEPVGRELSTEELATQFVDIFIEGTSMPAKEHS